MPFLAEDAALAAGMLAQTQQFGLSLGDRACLALALRRNVAALTADQEWSKLTLPIRIQVIRNAASH